jgi:hypothetical protein
MDADEDFENKSSSASCHIDQVQAIVFGGCNARFWMLRKHFNSMSKEDMKYLPFYSWQCLSLQLSHRGVDLVITREQDMGLLLKYLIHNMRTLDGERGSADRLLSFM